MIAVAKDILLDGYSVASILIQLQQLILIGFLGGDKMISDVEKCFVCEKIAEVTSLSVLSITAGVILSSRLKNVFWMVHQSPFNSKN